MRKTAFTLAFCLLAALQVFGQKSGFSFGMNATWFSDWERPSVLLNPEIILSKKVRNNRILVSADGFYAKSPEGQVLEVGDVHDRMIFTFKGNYALTSKNFLFGIGPAVRFRNEKRKKYLEPGWDLVGKQNEEYFDPGLNSSILYSFYTGKNSVSLKLSYSIFNRGANPLSLGVFYDWRW